MKKVFIKLTLASLVAIIVIKIAAAQLVLPTSLALKINPATPAPNSTAVATALLSGSDTSGASFTWFLNNVRQSDNSGTDKNTFSLPTGGLGAVYTVSVTISTTSGESLRDSISFTVSDADLTWSAQNEAPADYEGRVLPSEGSKIVASVLPIIFSPGTKTQLNPNNLNYGWFLNNIFDSKNSGLGKTTYKFQLNNPATLKVRITNTKNTIALEKSVNLFTVPPQVLVFLADQNGRIVYKNALSNITGAPGQKLNFLARPYFFNLPPLQLNWSWFVNDKKIAGAPQNPLAASLEIPKEILTPANFQITATVLNPYFNAENAQNLININVR